MNEKCLACIEAYATFLDAQAKGKVPPDQASPEIQDAITHAPSWQTHSIMGQMVMACVALPSCMDHLVPHHKTAQEKMALSGGLLVPGAGNGPRPKGQG